MAASSTIASVIQSQNIDLSVVLNEVIALLPTVLPTIITFLGIRKGLSFLIGSLRRA